MNFKLEFPEGKVLVDRTELKEALQEILAEVQEERESGEVLTIQEAAEYLKVSIPTVRKLISSNEIPHFKKGQVIRLNIWDLKEWLRRSSI